jgi:ABC-2 type transport system ATP-binding protein
MLLSVEDLVFDYPGHRALDHVSFSVERGTITALVGPNGAGKTTLLRCVAALESPFHGRVLLEGTDVHEHPRGCHLRMGYLSDFFGLYEDLTVEQCLLHRAGIQQVPAEQRDALVLRAAKRMQIANRLDQKAGTLSRGLRQRLAIAQAILHEPALVLLDEPASGLDPEARHSLSEVLMALRDDGMTLIVSSHILAELEDYSTHLLVVLNGRIEEHRAIGEVAKDGQLVSVAIELSAPDPRFAEVLASFPDGLGSETSGLTGEIVLPSSTDVRRRLLIHLLNAGLPVCEFSVGRQTLQDVYLERVRSTRSAGATRS